MKVDLFCRVESRVIERRKRIKEKKGVVEKMIGEGENHWMIKSQKMTSWLNISITT